MLPRQYIADVSIRQIVAFDPTKCPFFAGPTYLDVSIVSKQIADDPQPFWHEFLLERDALLMRGRIAAEILPSLSIRYNFLAEDGQLKRGRSVVQDTNMSPNTSKLCAVLPRGLWPVVRRLLRERKIDLQLPQSSLEAGSKLNLSASGPIRRVLRHIRHEPRGRFALKYGKSDVAVIALATDCRWPERQVVLVIREKKEFRFFTKAIQDSSFPAAAVKSKPILVLTPEELWDAAEKKRINYRKAIIFVADPTSVATRRMAYSLGHMCQARLYTFEQPPSQLRPYEPFVDARIACFFGVRQNSLAPKLNFIRKKTKLAQGSAASAFEAKRDLIWNNAARNAYVVRLAGNRVERLMLASHIAILVENDLHRDLLRPLISANDEKAAEQIRVYTFGDKIPWESLNVLIRADATTGIPECLHSININRKRALTLIDLCDQSQPVLGQSAAMRRRAYRQWLAYVSPGTLDEGVAAYLTRHSRYSGKKENQNGRV